MKVVIQVPIEKFFSFKNYVFDVELEPTNLGPWHQVTKIDGPLVSVKSDGLPVIHTGFFDSHVHFSWMGEKNKYLDLSVFKTIESMLVALEEQHKSYPPRTYWKAEGWNETHFGLSLEEFHQKVISMMPENFPLILERSCGHSAIVNKSFSKFLGLAVHQPILKETEYWNLLERLPRKSVEEHKEYLLFAQQLCLKNGIVAVGDMSQEDSQIQALHELATEGLLEMDVLGVLDARRALKFFSTKAQNFVSSKTSEFLSRPAQVRLQFWKKFIDGSLGSRTAWLSQPYSDEENQFGQALESDVHRLSKECLMALEKGFALSFHTIGDAAVDLVLELSDILEGFPLFKNKKHRLEHVQVLRDDQLERLSELGCWSVHVQPQHFFDDQGFSKKRLGPLRLWQQAYRLKSFQRKSVCLHVGSDGPISGLSPYNVIHSMLNLENPNERLNFDEALWFYTTGSKLLVGLNPGSISKGSLVCLTPKLQ